MTALRWAGTISADNHDECAPVFVLSGAPDDQRAKFLAMLIERGVAIEDAIVLAHRRKDAMTVAGSSRAEGTSGAIGNRLVAACSVIRRSQKPSDRLAAEETIERIVLGLVDWPEGLRTCNSAQQLAALGCRPEWLRQAVAALVARTAAVTDANSFGAASRAQLTAILGPLPIASLGLSQRVKKPTATVWASCAAAPESATPLLASSTVHGAKGMEFDAVLLALPAELRKKNGLDVLDEWEQGLNCEGRRVLYVGASRAKRVLAFGAGLHTERVETILRDRGVAVVSR